MPLRFDDILELHVNGQPFLISARPGEPLRLEDNPCAGWRVWAPWIDPCLVEAGARRPRSCGTRAAVRVERRDGGRAPEAPPDCPLPTRAEEVLHADAVSTACVGLGPAGYCTYPGLATAEARWRFIPGEDEAWTVYLDARGRIADVVARRARPAGRPTAGQLR